MFGLGKIRNKEDYIPWISDKLYAYTRGVDRVVFNTKFDKNCATFIVIIQNKIRDSGALLCLIYNKDIDTVEKYLNAGYLKNDHGFIFNTFENKKLKIEWDIPETWITDKCTVEMKTILKDGTVMKSTDSFTVIVDSDKDKSENKDAEQFRQQLINRGSGGNILSNV